MPQESIYYAMGRISVLQKNALDKTKLERLLQTSGTEEAHRVLGEIGWSESTDYEKMAENHVRDACKLVRAVATDEKVIDCFLLHYDIGNLKVLIKARCLDIQPESLSTCGIYPTDVLQHAVINRHYAALHPVLAKALTLLDKRLSVSTDPFDVDVTLDKAMYDMIFTILPDREKIAKSYFKAKVDIVNLIMALRTLHMGKNALFLKELLLPNGYIAESTWLKTFEKPENLPTLVNRYGTKVYHAAIAAQLSQKNIAQLECAMDDHLLSIYTPYKHDLDKPERIIGYLLMRQRESAAIRLIMAGKTNGFTADTIRERLRELYGR